MKCKYYLNWRVSGTRRELLFVGLGTFRLLTGTFYLLYFFPEHIVFRGLVYLRGTSVAGSLDGKHPPAPIKDPRVSTFLIIASSQ